MNILNFLTKSLICSITAISVVASCSNTNNEGSSTIYTPGYPSSYPNNKRCSWKITGPIGTKIQILRFSYHIYVPYIFHMHMEADSTCSYDYLKIYDGPSSSSNRVGAMCGDYSFDGMISSSNTLFLEFRSDRSNTYKGFQLVYSNIGM